MIPEKYYYIKKMEDEIITRSFDTQFYNPLKFC